MHRSAVTAQAAAQTAARAAAQALTQTASNPGSGGGRSIGSIPSDAVALARLVPALTDRSSTDGRDLRLDSTNHSQPNHLRTYPFHRCLKEDAIDDCVIDEARSRWCPNLYAA